MRRQRSERFDQPGRGFRLERRGGKLANGVRSANWAGGGYLSVRCAGDDEDVFYLFGPYGKIAYSADFGTTIQDKRGNLGDFVGINRFVNLCGG